LNPSDTTVRRAVSLVIHTPGSPDRVLVVLRPPDDPDLPDVWGLPAGRIDVDEELEAAARRTGREKLGVELEGIAPIRSGAVSRPGYRLEMDLVRARISSGEPSVPRPVPGITQYVRWRWAQPDVLRPAHEQGSLCCTLFFEARSHDSSAGER